MGIYYRIQPSGLGIKGHYSENSETINTDELSDGVHVFTSPEQLFCLDGWIEDYGDEILVIEAQDDWDNGDVEGVCIDPDESKIVARYTLDEFTKTFYPSQNLGFQDFKDSCQTSGIWPDPIIPTFKE